MTIKSLNGVSKERILKEFLGMLEGPFFMARGFPLMLSLGIDKLIPGLAPMLDSLKNCNQNPAWHAEGALLKINKAGKIIEMNGQNFVDEGLQGEIVEVLKCGTVYDHTLLVMEEMSNQDHDAIDMLAALLHDIGKPVSGLKHGKKNPEDNWPRTFDHDVVGAPLAKAFCKNLGLTNRDCDTIEWLVRNHMRAHQIPEMKTKSKIWRFVSQPLFPRLVKLARADERGCRKTSVDEWSGIDAALAKPEIAELIGKPLPKRILTGDFLIRKGYKPGPKFAKALDKSLDFQINENMTDEDQLFRHIKSILK